MRIFNINRYFGRSIKFRNGLSIGFNWCWSQGTSTRTSATLAAYHPPSSITWLWALYWIKPRKLLSMPSVYFRRALYGRIAFSLPLVGGLDLNWQPRMDRKASGGPRNE